MYLEAPLSSSGKSFQRGEKLIFRRSFTGVTEGSSMIELSQKLVHSLDLHYMPERTAYCRLDSKGDIEDVINLETSVERARVCGFRAGWQGATTQRAGARKEEQRSQPARKPCNRARSG
ncbi:MAG: hypothetical protein Q8M09_02540, partial [Pseudomonadota bacterium]|nr:hypothetical protein [Pseudomonadota bacterium]